MLVNLLILFCRSGVLDAQAVVALFGKCVVSAADFFRAHPAAVDLSGMRARCSADVNVIHASRSDFDCINLQARGIRPIRGSSGDLCVVHAPQCARCAVCGGEVGTSLQGAAGSEVGPAPILASVRRKFDLPIAAAVFDALAVVALFQVKRVACTIAHTFLSGNPTAIDIFSVHAHNATDLDGRQRGHVCALPHKLHRLKGLRVLELIAGWTV